MAATRNCSFVHPVSIGCCGAPPPPAQSRAWRLEERYPRVLSHSASAWWESPGSLRNLQVSWKQEAAAGFTMIRSSWLDD